MGRDPPSGLSCVVLSRFQSTRPVWGATGAYALNILTDEISIHAPRVGRDAVSCLAGQSIEIFQSTRPVWGATERTTTWPPRRSRFQSTRPVWGATTIYQNHTRKRVFQSTRPVWGATINDIILIGLGKISIHAPRVGRDRRLTAPWRPPGYFNPRAPCGARQQI